MWPREKINVVYIIIDILAHIHQVLLLYEVLYSKTCHLVTVAVLQVECYHYPRFIELWHTEQLHNLCKVTEVVSDSAGT